MSADDTLTAIRRLLGQDAPSGPTFGEIWARYFKAEGRHLKSSSVVAWRGRMLLEAWRTRPTLACDVEAAEAYRDLRMSSPTRQGDAPKPATVNRELACARRALQWALEHRPQLLPYNPLAGVAMADEDNVRHSRIETEADLQRLLEHADPLERAAILLYVDCGPRRMEVLSLQWSQLLMLHGRRPMIQLWDTKGGEPRRIGISMRAFEAVQALPRADRYIFVGRAPGRYRGGNEAPIRPGTHLSADSFCKRFQRLCVRASVLGPDGKPFTIHDLRHTFAFRSSVLFQIPEKVAMKQGGWKTRSAWDRYGIESDEERAMLYDAIDAGIQEQVRAVRQHTITRAHTSVQSPTDKKVK